MICFFYVYNMLCVPQWILEIRLDFNHVANHLSERTHVCVLGSIHDVSEEKEACS